MNLRMLDFGPDEAFVLPSLSLVLPLIIVGGRIESKVLPHQRQEAFFLAVRTQKCAEAFVGFVTLE